MTEEQKKLWEEWIEEIKELQKDWMYEAWSTPKTIKNDYMFLAVDKELERLWKMEKEK